MAERLSDSGWSRYHHSGKNTTLTIRERDAAAARGRLAGGGSKGGCTSNGTAEILKSARKNGERP